MNPSNTTSGKATDMIAGICALPRLPCPCTKRHVMLNLTSAAAAAAAVVHVARVAMSRSVEEKGISTHSLIVVGT